MTPRERKTLQQMGFNNIDELKEAIKGKINDRQIQMRNRKNDIFLSDNEPLDFSFLNDFEIDFPELDFDFNFLDKE